MGPASRCSLTLSEDVLVEEDDDDGEDGSVLPRPLHLLYCGGVGWWGL